MFFPLSKEPSFTPTDKNYSTSEIENFLKNNIRNKQKLVQKVNLLNFSEL
jgi:hypothetical protein